MTMPLQSTFVGVQLPELPDELRDLMRATADHYASMLVKKPELYPTNWVLEQQAAETNWKRRGFVARVTLSAQYFDEPHPDEIITKKAAYKETWMVAVAGDVSLVGDINDPSLSRSTLRVRQVQVCVWRDDQRGWSVVQTEGMPRHPGDLPTTSEGDTWPSPG